MGRIPFRVHIIQTDNGHGFQSQFHWHCEDLDIRPVFIKPASPHLNGKAERSHLTDQTEFYQLIEYTDDVDIAQKLSEWEIFLIITDPMLLSRIKRHIGFKRKAFLQQ